MNHTYLVFPVEGDVREETTEGVATLEQFQSWVGGFIECVSDPRGESDVVLIVNENGRNEGLPVNPNFPGLDLRGPVVGAMKHGEEMVGLPDIVLSCYRPDAIPFQTVEVLDKIIYSNERRLPLRVYVYEGRYHRGGVWFDKVARQDEDDEVLDIDTVEKSCMVAFTRGEEVRICNAADHCVYHQDGKKLLWPDDADEFWRSLRCQ